MFGSEILDVAIGLTMMFLLLSLVSSSVKEALETVLKYRSRDLERGIREMFGSIEGKDLVALFYNQPLINGLFKGTYNAKDTRNLPSYIPVKTFSLALMDLIWLSDKRTKTDAKSVDPVAEFKEAVTKAAGNSNLAGALLPLIDAAGNDIGQVRENIEHWYNSAMDRVSGGYKRRTQIIIGCIGLLLSAMMNMDTLGIARYLDTSQTSRSVLIAKAQLATQASSGLQNPTTTELSDPLGWIERQGGVPLGWVLYKKPGQTEADFNSDWRRPPSTAAGWLYKVAGLLCTTFAISLGAPFWFDVLNRIMVIRSTVKPEEKSPEEKSKA